MGSRRKIKIKPDPISRTGLDEAMDKFLGTAKKKPPIEAAPQTFTKTFAKPEPEEDMVKKSKRPKLKFEDERTRQTFWLTEEEIQMVQRLADKTGFPKYKVVSTAIQELYNKLITQT